MTTAEWVEALAARFGWLPSDIERQELRHLIHLVPPPKLEAKPHGT